MNDILQRRTLDPIYEVDRDPLLTDDSGKGVRNGDDWRSTQSGEVFTCIDNTVGAANWVNVTKVLEGTAPIVKFGLIAAPFLAADVNDFVIPQLPESNNVYFVNTSGGNIHISGIDASGIANGQEITFYNVTLNDVTLLNNSPLSLPENRIVAGVGLLTNDVPMQINDSCTLWRDGFFNRWRVKVAPKDV